MAGTRVHGIRLSQNAMTVRQILIDDESSGAVWLWVNSLGLHEHKGSLLGIYDTLSLFVHNLLGLSLRSRTVKASS